MFQNVHLEIGGAFGMLAVSASRKYHLFTGDPSIAPASRIKSARRSPPATRISDNRGKMPRAAMIAVVKSRATAAGWLRNARMAQLWA